MSANASGRVPDGTGLAGFAPSRDASRPVGAHPSRYEVVPVTGRAAIRWVSEVHRHLPKLQGALFAVGVSNYGHVVGVATAGNPARVWQGTGRLVITRCAAITGLPRLIGNDGREHAAPVCSMLYGALCRAATALGYREAWTYTLPGECGKTLLAAGFIDMGVTSGGEWSREDRARDRAVCALPKRRWMRSLSRHELPSLIGLAA